MNASHKKLFLLIGILFPYSCSMSSDEAGRAIIDIGSAGLGLVGAVGSASYNIAKSGLSTARTLAAWPFYEKPFFVDFLITKTTETIAGKREKCFSIQITTHGDNPPRSIREGDRLAEQFVSNYSVTYNSKLRRELVYEKLLTSITPTISISKQNKIRSAWLNLEEKLNTKYIEDLDFSGTRDAFHTKVRVGTNGLMSILWTSLYDDVADFAGVMGIAMPRIETKLHYLLTNNVTKAIAATALLSTLGYLAYTNREQIGATTVSDIGGMMQTGASATVRGAGSALQATPGRIWGALTGAKNWAFRPSTPVTPQQNPAATITPETTQTRPSAWAPKNTQEALRARNPEYYEESPLVLPESVPTPEIQSSPSIVPEVPQPPVSSPVAKAGVSLREIPKERPQTFGPGRPLRK